MVSKKRAGGISDEKEQAIYDRVNARLPPVDSAQAVKLRSDYSAHKKKKQRPSADEAAMFTRWEKVRKKEQRRQNPDEKKKTKRAKGRQHKTPEERQEDKERYEEIKRRYDNGEIIEEGDKKFMRNYRNWELRSGQSTSSKILSSSTSLSTSPRRTKKQRLDESLQILHDIASASGHAEDDAMDIDPPFVRDDLDNEYSESDVSQHLVELPERKRRTVLAQAFEQNAPNISTANSVRLVEKLHLPPETLDNDERHELETVLQGHVFIIPTAIQGIGKLNLDKWAFKIGRARFCYTNHTPNPDLTRIWFLKFEDSIWEHCPSPADRIEAYTNFFSGFFDHDYTIDHFITILKTIVGDQSGNEAIECTRGMIRALVTSKSYILANPRNSSITLGLVAYVFEVRLRQLIGPDNDIPLEEKQPWHKVLDQALFKAASVESDVFNAVLFEGVCRTLARLYRMSDYIFKTFRELLEWDISIEAKQSLREVIQGYDEEEYRRIDDNEIAEPSFNDPAIFLAWLEEHAIDAAAWFPNGWNEEAVEGTVIQDTIPIRPILHFQTFTLDLSERLLMAAIATLNIDVVQMILLYVIDPEQRQSIKLELHHLQWLHLELDSNNNTPDEKIPLQRFSAFPQQAYIRLSNILEACLENDVGMSVLLLPFIAGSKSAFNLFWEHQMGNVISDVCNNPEMPRNEYGIQDLMASSLPANRHILFSQLLFTGATKILYAQLVHVLAILSTLGYVFSEDDYIRFALIYKEWDSSDFKGLLSKTTTIRDLAEFAATVLHLPTTSEYGATLSSLTTLFCEWIKPIGKDNQPLRDTFNANVYGFELSAFYCSNLEDLKKSRYLTDTDMKMDKPPGITTPLASLGDTSGGLVVIKFLDIPIWFQGRGLGQRLVTNVQQTIVRTTGRVDFLVLDWAHAPMYYLVDRFYGWRAFSDQLQEKLSRGAHGNFFTFYKIKIEGHETRDQQSEHLVTSTPLVRYRFSRRRRPRGFRTQMDLAWENVIKDLNTRLAVTSNFASSTNMEGFEEQMEYNELEFKESATFEQSQGEEKIIIEGKFQRIDTDDALTRLGNTDMPHFVMVITNVTLPDIEHDNREWFLFSLVQFLIDHCREFARPLRLEGNILEMLGAVEPDGKAFKRLWRLYGDPAEKPYPLFEWIRNESDGGAYVWTPQARPPSVIRHDAAVLQQDDLIAKIVLQYDLEAKPDRTGKIGPKGFKLLTRTEFESPPKRED